MQAGSNILLYTLVILLCVLQMIGTHQVGYCIERLVALEVKVKQLEDKVNTLGGYPRLIAPGYTLTGITNVDVNK